MGDSESFTSLDDLINSHMSKPDVQASGSENHIDKLIQDSVAADLAASPSSIAIVQPPTRRFILPSLELGNNTSEASGILAKQISNTIRAQGLANQRSKQEEQLSLMAATTYSDEDEEIIDLMKGMMLPDEPIKRPPTPEMENIVFTYNDSDMRELPVTIIQPSVPDTPCLLDREPTPYATRNNRRNRVKCSNVGKAICTSSAERQRPYYNPTKQTKVLRFDFSAMSPDDIINATLRKPIPIRPRIFN